MSTENTDFSLFFLIFFIKDGIIGIQLNRNIYEMTKGDDFMDIMNVSSALSAVQLADSTSSVTGAVSMKMLDNALDMNQTMNDSMVKMMENSVTPYLGGNIDTYV
jgi:hypothetical protein